MVHYLEWGLSAGRHLKNSSSSTTSTMIRVFEKDTVFGTKKVRKYVLQENS